MHSEIPIWLARSGGKAKSEELTSRRYKGDARVMGFDLRLGDSLRLDGSPWSLPELLDWVRKRHRNHILDH